MGQDMNTQLHRSMQEPQCDMSYSSVASQLVGKTPEFSIFSGDLTQKGEVSFQKWMFEVKCVIQSHTEATLREGIVYSLWEATADLLQYLGLHAPVSHIINKLELLYGIVASFDVLMQNFTNYNREGQKGCQYTILY